MFTYSNFKNAFKLSVIVFGILVFFGLVQLFVQGVASYPFDAAVLNLYSQDSNRDEVKAFASAVRWLGDYRAGWFFLLNIVVAFAVADKLNKKYQFKKRNSLFVLSFVSFLAWNYILGSATTSITNLNSVVDNQRLYIAQYERGDNNCNVASVKLEGQNFIEDSVYVKSFVGFKKKDLNFFRASKCSVAVVIESYEVFNPSFKAYVEAETVEVKHIILYATPIFLKE